MIKLASLTLCAALLAPAGALAATHNLGARIDYAQQVGCLVPSSARGTATATLDDVTGSFSYTVTFGNNAPAFDDGLLNGGAAELSAHFHGPAAPGFTASPVAPIAVGSPVSATVTLTGVQITQVLGGLWYVNIHSVACVGGEIRGQLLLGDFDGDGIPDADDSCPTVVNTGSDSETDPQLAFACTGLGTPYSVCTGPGTTTAGDGVDAACDTCPDHLNPVIASPAGAANRTRVSGQLDDDGDGVGNRCDFDHDQVGLFISPSDFAQAVDTQLRAFPSVGNSDCGLNIDPVFAMLPCGVFDHDSIGLFPSPVDFMFDVERQSAGLVQNGPSCGAACTPAFGGAIGSGTETLGKAICDGPRC